MGLDARQVGVGSGLTLLLLALVIISGCSEIEPPANSGNTGEELAVQETRVRKWVEYRGGRMIWEFRGEVVRYYENPERVEADSVVVDFYNEDEQYESTLIADYGKIDRKTSDMEAIGNVVMTNVDGTKIETESVFYKDEDELIYTDDFVTIYRGNEKLTGYGLETDTGLNETKIKKNVTAVTIEGRDG